MLCSICIATYKRPELLNKLIASLIIQRLNNSIELEVIIIDNDKELSAKIIYDKFRNNSKTHFVYDMQPVKNISLTRNVAVKKAKGDYLLFIDDDEYAEKDWVNKLLNSVEKYFADGAFGKVVPYFNFSPPKWIKDCYVFNRNVNQTGQQAAGFYTTNTIIKASLLKNLEEPFESKYGITGGSDSKLFSSLKLKGAKFINCSEAITYEFIPSERANIKWLIKRVFRTGNNHSRILISLSDNSSFARIQEFFYGSSQSIIALFLAFIYVWHRTKSLSWFLKSISNIGKVFAVFSFHPLEYK